MGTESMNDMLFEQLLSRINQESYSEECKLDILFRSKGFFSALQASRILYAYKNGIDKVRAIQILEPRLCRMTTSEARDVIGAAHNQNDKLRVLQVLKRYLVDSQSREGIQNILSAYPFPDQKNKAIAILNTVRSDVFDQMASGGHQGYAALGGLYTQSRPLEPHLYGSVDEQWRERPGHGKINVPATARVGRLPSVYSSHPSYAPLPGRDYASDRGFPLNDVYNFRYASRDATECPAKPEVDNLYPAGAPPLGKHQGGAYSTGFPA